MSKTIFITGSSSGLGKSTAKLFQSKGWNVIATMRDLEEDKELVQLENVTVLKMDVTDLAQIQDAVEKAISMYDIDVVFNNAGYGLSGALESYSDERIVRQIDTNLLGVIRVTQAFIPYFREKRSGTFISTTSIIGQIGFPLISIYSATKFGVEGWSESMSYELEKFGITIKTVAPGSMITNFAGSSLDPNTHPSYVDMEKKLADQTQELLKHASTPEEVAEVVYEAATDNKDQLRYLAGNEANMLNKRYLEIGKEEFRKEMAKQFAQ